MLREQQLRQVKKRLNRKGPHDFGQRKTFRRGVKIVSRIAEGKLTKVECIAHLHSYLAS